MKNAFAAIAAATLVLGGCASSETGRETGKDSAKGDVSSLDMKLTVPGGITLNSLDYSVTGAALPSARNQSVNLTNSSLIRFQVGNLPVSTSPYNIALAATATDGTPCAGNQAFTIASNLVTSLSVQLVCSRGNTVDRDDNGDLRVTVNVEVVNGVACPVVTGISALPAETAVGTSLQLEGFTSSTDGATVAWTGTGGSFAAAASANTAFTCATPGDHDLTLTVSKAGCASNSYAATVTCTGTPVDAGLPDAVVTLPDATLPDAEITAPDATLPDATLPDATLPDATLPDASGPVLTACQQCVRAAGPANPCRDWLGGGDMVAGCLENADPAVAERCIALVRCSLTATDNCAADPTGVTKCYCGATSIDSCFTNPATPPAGACIAQVNALTQCTTPGCVETRLTDMDYAYYGYFLTLCAASADGCGAACTIPQTTF